MLQHSVFVLI